MKVVELFKENDQNSIVLPDFQRDLEWKVDKQKNLLASILVKLSIGSLLLIKGCADDYKARAIGINNKSVRPKEDCYYLLDGQQRLTSLKLFFSDFFECTSNWRDRFDELYSQLRSRWFVRVIPKENDEDRFGYLTLKFDSERISKAEPEDIKDFIVYKKIFKTKTKELHHPEILSKSSSSKRDVENFLMVVKAFSSEGLVPLYALSNSSASKNGLDILKQTLEKIGDERRVALKAEIAQIDSIEEQAERKISFLGAPYDLEPEKEESYWYNLSSQWATDVYSYFKGLLDLDIPTSILPSDEISRGIAIFTSINEGGQKLSTYDLVCAKAAKELDESLSGFIRGILLETNALEGLTNLCCDTWYANDFGSISDNKLEEKLKNHYLNMLSIVAHEANGNNLRLEFLKAKKHLEISPNKIRSSTPLVMRAIIRSYAFLNLRCGVLSLNDIPYQLMVIPIANIFLSNSNWLSLKVWDKLEFWYWASLFSGQYRDGQNDKCVRDANKLYEWIEGSTNPFSQRVNDVFQATNYSDLDTLLLKNEESVVPGAVHLGLLQFVLSNCPRDLIKTNNEYRQLKAWEISSQRNFSENRNNEIIIESVQDHHIFPLAQATTVEQSTRKLRSDKKNLLNSPLNRTFISDYANKKIAGKSVTQYLSSIDQSVKDTHLIPDKYIDYTQPNYEELLKARFEKIRTSLNQELNSLV